MVQKRFGCKTMGADAPVSCYDHKTGYPPENVNGQFHSIKFKLDTKLRKNTTGPYPTELRIN